MKPDFSLSIPRPCSEKWEYFTPQSNGGFCYSCSKTVVDFTRMSDSQIFAYFKDKPTHTCGRFRQDQLKGYYRNVDVIRINPGFTLFKAGVVGLLFMVINNQSNAAPTLPGFRIENIQQVHYTVTENKTTPDKSTISGVVLDESGIPMPGVNVVLKGTTLGTVTDSEGKFWIEYEVTEKDVLVFSFLGYVTQELKIKEYTTANITMTMDEVEWMGEIAYDDVYDSRSEPKGLWTRLKNLFR